MGKDIVREMIAPLDRKILILMADQPGIGDDEICAKLDIPITYVTLVMNRLIALGLARMELPVPPKHRN